MNKQRFHLLFPLGSHLCREPMPSMSELKRDMENLKRHGFNLIKLQESWMADEPLEGNIDLSKYEELIEHAARLDLGVYLGLTCEQAPGWLYRKYPDCRMVGRDGYAIHYEAQTCMPGDGKPGPCYDHPGAMDEQLRFIRELVRILGRYENVVVWNTWQEIGYGASAGQQVCYCPNTLDDFRAWLRERYGDLDGLNRAWNSRHASWEYVVPDRGVMRCALPQDVDWNYFTDNVRIAAILRRRAETIRAADPLGRPVFAHLGPPSVAFGSSWTYARCQDFLGSSCYPAWWPFCQWDDAPPRRQHVERPAALLAEAWGGVCLNYDLMRSCNEPGRPVWAAEFQGGPVSTFFHRGRVPAPEDIRRWMLTAAASGVTAISFWVTRAEIMAQETNGFSLLDSEGDTTPRFEEAARVGAALNRHPELFGRPSWNGAEVAIILNEWNAQFCAACAPTLEHLAYSNRGWHRLLWDNGIPVDFIEAGQIRDLQPHRYKALILPFPLSLSEDVAAQLCRYVKQGGALISEAGPGRLNEHGIANRGELSPALRALFGARHRSFDMVREPSATHSRWSPVERTWGEYLDAAMLTGAGPLAGLRARANVYIETFDCEGSAPVLHCGDAIAGVWRRAGQGQAWLLGTYVGHSGTAYRDPENHKFVRTLMAACGVETARAGELLVRKRAISGKQAWFFTNPTDHDVAAVVPVGRGRVEDLLGEPLTVVNGEVSLAVRALDVRALIVTCEEQFS
ncbi:MAG: beta-galactosidase [Kiritimatiellae bacterium]|nr:beta-galactosidase [Kiritimatiellia bacterium]